MNKPSKLPPSKKDAAAEPCLLLNFTLVMPLDRLKAQAGHDKVFELIKCQQWVESGHLNYLLENTVALFPALARWFLKKL